MTTAINPKEPKEPIQLRIAPVIESARELSVRIAEELPTHAGIVRVAEGVLNAAITANDSSKQIRRLFSFHRLPVFFLTVCILGVSVWSYLRFVHVSELTIAVSERDAIAVRQNAKGRRRVSLQAIETKGSRENLRLLEERQVDLAFVQGGITIPDDLLRLEVPTNETVLLLLSPRTKSIRDAQTILTSVEGQGSHSVCLQFLDIWGIREQITFDHRWPALTAPAGATGTATVTDEPLDLSKIDAVFVVKDLANQSIFPALEKLKQADFRFESPILGVRYRTLGYLTPVEIPPAHFFADPPSPKNPLSTYEVSTFIAARPELTPRLLAEAIHLLDSPLEKFRDQSFEFDLDKTGEFFQMVDAILGIVAYIGLAFLTLLGYEITLYRKRFNELNTLVSLISMHQSNKDVLQLPAGKNLQENLTYLSICSDLLGLIGVITGYYAQENPSLMYNRMMETIQQRSSSLKLNIQLKILHTVCGPAVAGAPSLLPLQSPAAQANEDITPKELAPTDMAPADTQAIPKSPSADAAKTRPQIESSTDSDSPDANAGEDGAD